MLGGGRLTSHKNRLYIPLCSHLFSDLSSLPQFQDPHQLPLENVPLSIPISCLAMAAVAAPEMEDLRAPKVKKRFFKRQHMGLNIEAAKCKDEKHMKHGHVLMFFITIKLDLKHRFKCYLFKVCSSEGKFLLQKFHHILDVQPCVC